MIYKRIYKSENSHSSWREREKREAKRELKEDGKRTFGFYT